QCGGAAFDISANVALPLAKVQRVCLSQPNVTIDAGAFVEPAVAETGIHASDQIILSAIVREIRKVEAEWRIDVVVAPSKISVQEDKSVAKGTVEVEHEALATV